MSNNNSQGKTDPLLTKRIREANPKDAPPTRGPIRTPPTIGRMVSKVAQPVFEKMGFEDAHILSHWTEIIGPELAPYVNPLKLSKARKGQARTLTIAVPGPLTLEIQHRAPQILDRINRFYGYPAVAKLRLVHSDVDLI